ncbi:DUF6286 domain-containing protein [Protofrankia symbiont of Coriaria ruscifolia]|uniref:DUF6286 domain-containing protein n=1 Tax=Protofrankia symbiont of Coriaria ruscifolia TaxID=1306542 RepID=UPI0013EFAEBF|nr:DUF6286 domain-containing protein [Protofrankia symbiont of Coriaria ruscifolia]
MRLTNRIVAALLAAALAAAGVIAIVEMVNAALDNGYAIVDWRSAVDVMTRNTWSNTGPAVLAVVLIIAGVLLLTLGILRGPAEWLALRPISTGTRGFVSRSGLSRSLDSAVTEVDDVSRAKVRLQRHTMTIMVELHPRSSADTPAQVLDRVREHLALFDLVAPPKTKVKTSRRPARDRNVVPEPAPHPTTPPTASPTVPPTASPPTASPPTASPPTVSPPTASPPTASPPTASGASFTAPSPTAAPEASGGSTSTSTSVTEANFGAPARRGPYPVGLDLTKPDPANDRENEQ